jgi:hypothetical protein
MTILVCYYNKAEYNKLTSAQKLGVKRYKQGSKHIPKKNKGPGQKQYPKALIKAVASELNEIQQKEHDESNNDSDTSEPAHK